MIINTSAVHYWLQGEAGQKPPTPWSFLWLPNHAVTSMGCACSFVRASATLSKFQLWLMKSVIVDWRMLRASGWTLSILFFFSLSLKQMRVKVQSQWERWDLNSVMSKQCRKKWRRGEDVKSAIVGNALSRWLWGWVDGLFLGVPRHCKRPVLRWRFWYAALLAVMRKEQNWTLGFG